MAMFSMCWRGASFKPALDARKKMSVSGYLTTAKFCINHVQGQKLLPGVQPKPKPFADSLDFVLG